MRAPLTCRDVAFALAPRLNAAGRLGTAQEALELLLTEDPERARDLAASLDRQNRERRAVEDTVFAEAEAQLARFIDPIATRRSWLARRDGTRESLASSLRGC